MRTTIKVLMPVQMASGVLHARLRASIVAGALLAAPLLPPGVAGAPGQVPLPGITPAAVATNTPISSTKTIEARLAEARTNLAVVVGLGDAGITNAPAGVSLQDVWLRRAMLERLVRLYEQQLSYALRLETAKV